MTLDEFKRSTSKDQPSASLSRPLLALWQDARGDWTAAHETAQEIEDAIGSWIHAYLHRKEGDLGNAGYWYSRAGKKMPAQNVTLETEWEELARALVK